MTDGPARALAHRPRVVLVGPPGAGKSTVGAELAKRWGIELRDTDSDIETALGRSISDVFVEDGEARFRALEQDAVTAGLAEHAGVLSLGGGAVLAAATRALLGPHRVVFLDVGLAEAAKRVGLGVTRPLLLGNVRGQLKALLDARRPLYAEVAGYTVLTDQLGVEAVADAIERWLDE